MLDTKSSDYAVKLENVFRAYERTLDLDIALNLSNLTEEEKIAFITDPDLHARMNICDSNIRAILVQDTIYLSRSAKSEGVRLAAIKELGKTLYPKRFKDGDYNDKPVPITIAYEVVERVEA
jgi:hypothetical protein